MQTPLQHLDADALAFYRRAIALLTESGVPFLVGGAYALQRYTGIVRHTKDFDTFCRPNDAPRLLDVFARVGYRTEVTFTHWLGKAFHGDNFIDVIYSSGNGGAPVDDDWFKYAVDEEVLDQPVKLVPAEELIWQKAYIMERERYDGNDVAHLLRACGPTLDWSRLLRRFDKDWRVLLGHLIFFGFIYPGERDRIPGDVLQTLLRRLRAEEDTAPVDEHLCRGTLLSREQYLTDLNKWGYEDARLWPRGNLSEEQIAAWTEGIYAEPPAPTAGASTDG